MLRRTGVMHLLAAAVLAGSSLSAHAITYEYQGNLFDFPSSTIDLPCDPGTGGCMISSVMVSLEFAAPLAANLAFGSVTPDAWLIFDGLTTITDATPGIAMSGFLFAMSVGTDGLGDIDEWNIDINPTSPGTVATEEWSRTRTINQGGAISDDTRYCQAGSCSSQGLAIIADNAGTWTTIPLPAGVWLFAGALGALIGARRRAR